MSGDDLADQVWRGMSAFVLDNRDGWGRAVVDRSGLPFSRIRILKRLSRHPMTVKEIAAAATILSSAASASTVDRSAPTPAALGGPATMHAWSRSASPSASSTAQGPQPVRDCARLENGDKVVGYVASRTMASDQTTMKQYLSKHFSEICRFSYKLQQ